MVKKIYVGNLPYSAGDTELRTFFEKVGPVVTASVVVDKITGRPRGFGFVEMDEADADKAIGELNGADMDGRALTVNEARPREDR